MWMLERKGCFANKWTLENDSVCRIGRCLTSTICCRSTYVSRNHCTITVNGGRIHITDLKSTNGTFINGETIGHSVDKTLKDGDEIGLGIDGQMEILNEPDIFVFRLKKVPSPDNHSYKYDIDLTNDDIVKPKDNRVGNTASCVTKINSSSHLIANIKVDKPNNFIDLDLINDQNIPRNETDNPTSEKRSLNASLKFEQIEIDKKDAESKKNDVNDTLQKCVLNIQPRSNEKNREEENGTDTRPGNSSKIVENDDDCDLIMLGEYAGVKSESSSKLNHVPSSSNMTDNDSKQISEIFKQPNDDSMTRLSSVRKRHSAVDIAPPAKQMKISFDSRDVSMKGTLDSTIDNNTTGDGQVLKIKQEHDYSQIDSCIVLKEEEGDFPCSQLFDNHEQNTNYEIIISDESDNENDNDVCVINSDDDDELAVNPWLLKLSQSKSPPQRNTEDDENGWWPDLSQTLDEVDALKFEPPDDEWEENDGIEKDSNKDERRSSCSSEAAALEQMPINEQEVSSNKELNKSDPKTVDVIKFYSPEQKPTKTKKTDDDSKEKLLPSKTRNLKDEKENSLHLKTRSQSSKHVRTSEKDEKTNDKTSKPIVKTKNTMNNAYSTKKSIDEELKKRKASPKTRSRSKSKSSKPPPENNKSIVDERKKRLKELALKQKDNSADNEVKVLNRAKAKVTNKNRSTFLAEDIAGVTLSQMDSTLAPENNKKAIKLKKERIIKLEEPDLDTKTSNDFDLERPPSKRKLSSTAEFNPVPSTSGQFKSFESNISTATERKKTVSQTKFTEAKAQPVKTRRKSKTENVPPEIKCTETKEQPVVSKSQSTTESVATKKSNYKKKEHSSTNSDLNVNKIDSTNKKEKLDTADDQTFKIAKMSFKSGDKLVSNQKKVSRKSNIENENKTVPTKKTEIHPRRSILKSCCNENNKIKKSVTNEPKKSVHFNLTPQIVTIERAVENKIEPKRNYEHLMHRKLEEVLFIITKWKVSWLVEQKNIKKPPPVSPFELQYMLSTFTSYSDYFQIVLPLMLYELWSEIFVSWENMRKRLCYGSVYNIHTFPAGNAQMMKIECAVLINDAEVPDTSPKAGDLVVIEIASKCDDGKVEFTSVFAYVETHTRRRIRSKEDYFPTDVLYHVPSPTTKVTLSLKSRFLNKQVDKDRAMRIRSVHYIRPSIRTIEAVINLPFSPLVDLILDPKKIVCTSDKLNEELFTKNKLNPYQLRTVFETCQTCLQPQPNICLIHGPPGTGKTLVIINIILQLLYGNQRYEKSQQPRILVCTPSNAAIDNITQTLLEIRATLTNRFKMVRVGRAESSNAFVKGITLSELAKKHIDETNKQIVMDSVKIEVDTLKAKMNCIVISIESALAKKKDTTLLEKQLFDCKRRCDALSNNDNTRKNHAIYKLQEAEERILCGADIVCTTLGSSFSGQIGYLLKNKKNHFTCCIIDEATQCTEPEILVPLMHGIKTLVLVGDTCQLPGTVISQESKEHGYGQSLFGRIQKTFEHEAVSPVKFLNVQYRMHPDICSWPNKFFYSEKLINSPTTLIKTPLVPYRVFSHEFTESEQMTNTGEADLIIRLLKTSLNLLQECNYSIGIITPYQRQKQLIWDMILKEFRSSSIKRKIEVKTVDGYQGRESDIIIISCVRSDKIGFLSDFERLNVALTRAKRALYICVNFSTLIENSIWKALKLDAIQRKMYTYVGKKTLIESNIRSMITQID